MNSMTSKIRLALFSAVFLWASAFVGIRYGLQTYSPEGLALLRYLIASACMGVIYWRLPKRSLMPFKDRIGLILIGMVGIGLYNLALNYGEISLSSGTASFIISQSPIISAFIAIFMLGEKLTFIRFTGFVVSVLGVALITIGEQGEFTWSVGLLYVLVAAITGSLYSVLQKPFLKKYHVIEATTYLIWGGTLFLGIYANYLIHDFETASWTATSTIIYLAVFPASLGYLAWGYGLSRIPAAQAVSYLYYMPFIATLLGWLLLDEIPAWLSVIGGIVAIVGVWLVNKSYRYSPLKVLEKRTA